MRPIGMGLAAALILAIATPAALMATSAAAKPAAAATDSVTKESRDKGKAAAPGLIQGAGLDCQVADARLIGINTDAKTKAKTTFYELACTGNEGVIVAQAQDNTYQIFTCMETSEPGADGKPSSLRCILPANADPKAGLVSYVAKSGVHCTADKLRAL